MGTIVIEEWVSVGTPDSQTHCTPIFKDQVKVTVDSTTSTGDETLALDGRTRFISVTAVEAHRVNVDASTTGSSYAHVNAGERRDIAVPSTTGATISYRADA